MSQNDENAITKTELIIDYDGMSQREIATFQEGVKQKGIVGTVKRIAKDLLLSKEERNAKKDFRLQVIKRVGHGYFARLHLEMNSALNLRREELEIETQSSLSKLLDVLNSNFLYISSRAEEILTMKANSLNKAYNDVKKRTSLPFDAAEIIADYGQRSMNQYKRNILQLENNEAQRMIKARDFANRAISTSIDAEAVDNFIESIKKWGE